MSSKELQFPIIFPNLNYSCKLFIICLLDSIWINDILGTLLRFLDNRASHLKSGVGPQGCSTLRWYITWTQLMLVFTPGLLLLRSLWGIPFTWLLALGDPQHLLLGLSPVATLSLWAASLAHCLSPNSHRCVHFRVKWTAYKFHNRALGFLLFLYLRHQSTPLLSPIWDRMFLFYDKSCKRGEGQDTCRRVIVPLEWWQSFWWSFFSKVWTEVSVTLGWESWRKLDNRSQCVLYW